MNSEIERLHPYTIIMYVVAVVLVEMLTMNIFIIAEACIGAFIVGIVLMGPKKAFSDFLFEILLSFFTILIQPLFSRAGTSVLFYINDYPVSTEAYIYGLMVAILLVSIIQWNLLLTESMDSKKIIYICGTIWPKMGLTISMILNLIPSLKKRYQIIHEAQISMFGQAGGWTVRLKRRIREISILLSWTLEGSMEKSMSMEARGYRSGKRENVFDYKFRLEDKIGLTLIISLGALTSLIIGTSRVNMWYLPKVSLPQDMGHTFLVMVLYACLILLPLIVKIRGDYRWRSLNTKE